MNRGGELRIRLKEGGFIGGHVFFNDPAITEAMALSGYNFIWIDAEHGPFDKQQLLLHVMAANGAGAAAFVRVTTATMEVVKPVLEMGIDALIIPMITSVEEAEAALKLCLYPPKGIRGFGPRRAIAYNTQDLGDYLAHSEESFLRIIQIEHIDAVSVIDELLALDALDAIIIGPNDLSASMGLLGDSLHPDVLEASRVVIDAAKRAGKPVGVSIGPNEAVIRTWQNLGIDFMSVGDDISFIHNGVLNTFAMVKHK